jgi:hypothetical protein
MALTKTPIELSSTPGIVDNSNETAITIDDSENVLVGKTTSSAATPGHELKADGAAWHTADGTFPLFLNRETDDGELIRFRKDNSNVGSIGTVLNGTEMYLAGSGANTSGIFFSGANSLLSMKAGTLANGTQDLGAGSYRWKDLYLSGGAYLGGTAAANKLDDYEEGTWSLTSNATITNTIVAQYVRIGRLVTGVVDVQLASGQTSTTALDFNVPFTLDGNYGAGVVNYTNGSLVAEPLTVNPDPVNMLYIRYAHQNNASIAHFTGARIIFNFTYFTNA